MSDNLPFRETKVIELARELAMDIQELPEILKAYGVSDDEFERIKNDPFFQQTLDVFMVEWNSASNSERRVRFKAQASIEAALLDLHKAVVDTQQPLNHRVTAAQFIAKLAGLGQDEKAAPSGPGFSITINMGDTAAPITIDAVAQPAPEAIEVTPG